jgi:ABC-type transport system involved in multi-copper enzyme maturation permease subunit
MIRAVIGKEWREHRSMFLIYWMILNGPVLVLALGLAFSSYARLPFVDLSDATVLKYLPAALVEGFLLTTLFLFVSGYLAVCMFSADIEDGALFFVHEQPISRKWYVSLKLLAGALQIVGAVVFSILFAAVAVWLLMLASGKVTRAGSAGTFLQVLGAGLRMAGWCSLISLATFTWSALIASLAPRRWMAALGSVLITGTAIYWGADFFSFFPDVAADSITIGMSFGTGNNPWLNLTGALRESELLAFAKWKALPLSVLASLTAAFSVMIGVVYQRREIR